MEIVGLVIVKNEEDIIEAFVRHNAALLGRLIVIDNASTDNTLPILENLAGEGIALTIESDAGTNHPQFDALNRYLRKLRNQSPDFVFMLDADEFVNCESRDVLVESLASLPRGACGLLWWDYYVPVPEDNQQEVNPVRRIRHCRPPNQNHHKVVLPKSILDSRDFVLEPGAHSIVVDAPPEVNYQPLNHVSLAHFPVRSAEQIASKVIVGEWALSSRNNRVPNEGFHWRDLHRRVMSGANLTTSELREIASNYSTEGPIIEYELIEKPLRPEVNFDLKYASLVKNDYVQNALRYSDAHFNRLSTTALTNGNVSIGKTPFGILAYHEGDTVIGRSIKLYGEWASGEINFLKRFVVPGDWVVDVGANIGTHTIPFSGFVGPTGKVFAFEPQRIPFQLLSANAVLNNRYNVYTMHLGLGSRAGAVRVPVHLNGNIGTVGAGHWGTGDPVQIVTIDTFNYSSVKLIKIDVEGMERDVLLGAAQTIKRCKPFIFIENNIETKSKALIQTLFDFGYRCWWFFEPYYNPDNYYGNPDNIFTDVGRPEVNMICVPRSRKIRLDGLTMIDNPADNWRQAWEKQFPE